MTSKQFFDLFNYEAKGYRGLALNRYEFNILRELNIFKGIVFDNLMDEKVYETWLCFANLEALIKCEMITEEDFAWDVAFILSFCYSQEQKEDNSRVLMNKMTESFLPLFKVPTEENVSAFYIKVTENVNEIACLF